MARSSYPVNSNIMILLVRAFSFKNHVAGQAVLNHKAELRLVNYVLLRSEVHQESLGQELLFIVVHGHWRHTQSRRYVSKR